MDTFNNMERSGYDELVSYGPLWWTEYREMDAVYRFAGWTLDLMALWLEKIVQNQFPAHMDAETCTVFEKILKLRPGADATLDSRRAAIAALYPNTGRFSASLIRKIILLQTGYEAEIWCDGGKVRVRIPQDDEAAFSSSAIGKILESKLPAHVGYGLSWPVAAFALAEGMEIRDVHKIQGLWWDRERLLSGGRLLDGTDCLDQEMPPLIRPCVWRFGTGAEGAVSFTWHVLPLAALLDGTACIDGNINLNSGKEVL